jgi:hypothetical protein
VEAKYLKLRLLVLELDTLHLLQRLRVVPAGRNSVIDVNVRALTVNDNSK